MFRYHKKNVLKSYTVENNQNFNYTITKRRKGKDLLLSQCVLSRNPVKHPNFKRMCSKDRRKKTTWPKQNIQKTGNYL